MTGDRLRYGHASVNYVSYGRSAGRKALHSRAAFILRGYSTNSHRCCRQTCPLTWPHGLGAASETSNAFCT